MSLSNFHLAEDFGTMLAGSTSMIRQEQYEIWIQSSSQRWDMLGCFQDRELAATLVKNHPVRARLICITFEYGKMISQESVAELGG